MKILQFRGQYPNFGDELNGWLWPKLLPGFFDEDPAIAFIGIGSTIGLAPGDAARRVVCGAGYAPDYHAAPPGMQDGTWDVRFVRGPRTAARLGLAPETALGDSAILLRSLKDYTRASAECVSFMPHWESMVRGHWEQACHSAGITLIDPRQPVVKVMEQLLRSKLVIAEAMHGAIVADAFRIPWVPVVPLNVVHRDKWYDWAEALDIKLRPQRLWPSSLTELSIKSITAPLKGRSRGAPVHDIRAEVADAGPGLGSRLKRVLHAPPVATRFDNWLSELAAHRLTQLAKVEPCLSGDGIIAEVTARMEEKMYAMQRDYASQGMVKRLRTTIEAAQNGKVEGAAQQPAAATKRA